MKKKDMFQDLKKNVLSKKPSTPTQTVSKVKESKLEDEEPFTLWIPKKVMKQLKLKKIETEKSIKNQINEAINFYLSNHY